MTTSETIRVITEKGNYEHDNVQEINVEAAALEIIYRDDDGKRVRVGYAAGHWLQYRVFTVEPK